MEEFLRYIKMIKRVLDIDYGKERVFYDSGDWYDRHASGNISIDEIEKELVSIALYAEQTSEYVHTLTDKIYELMGEEEAEAFFESID